MLPAHIAQNIRRQILYYLQATFSFRDKQADAAFQRFVEDPESGLFKGPWVMLRRPFRPAPDGVAPPFGFEVPFHPFVHQFRAWGRLSSRDAAPENTIVTTGTGSGKTECFQFPILDHCLRMRQAGRKGIKAIVLYPMNALAADQEKRFAEIIWKTPKLNAAGIRVGNYTGRYDPAAPGEGKDSGKKAMGPDWGVSNHEEQQEDPPDILLTNYRMLDFLLMRPQDQRLWRYNDPEVLRYLVLDELHTYDGAQGSDVACLIRRLKERLGLARGQLCVIGTSATLDDRGLQKEEQADGSADKAEAGKERLARFAETLFEETIPVEAVIDEDRLTVEEIVASELTDADLPEPNECHPRDEEDAEAYVMRQAGLWGGPVFDPAGEWRNGQDEAARDEAVERWELLLGDWLKHCSLFKCLLDVFAEAEVRRADPLAWQDLVERMTQREFALQKVAHGADREILLASFCSMVAHARELRSRRASVLVPTQVQLWVRELRRLGRVVAEAPAFRWLDEPQPGAHSLPAFHCSECGASGWVSSYLPDTKPHIEASGAEGYALESDPSKIYRGWFGFRDKQTAINRRSQYILVIYPEPPAGPETGEQPEKPVQLTLTAEDAPEYYLHPGSLVIRRGKGPCPLTGDERSFRVRIDNRTRKLENGTVVGEQGCPRCGSVEGLFFIGAQAATLASVAIDEMFGSILNNDPKLLAFTDSVQDASHRAGFFSSRTYHFTFRTALQHVVNAWSRDRGLGLKLTEAGERLFEYWSQVAPGRLGSVRETMTTLMPPDLQEYEPFQAYRNHSGQEVPPTRLFDAIKNRLTWQAVSEFGLMQTHGRTMELNGSAVLQWDATVIAAAVEELRTRIEGKHPVLGRVEDDRLRLWVYGFLHRYRERGALGHPYLVPLAKNKFWGKYPWGRTIPGRETFPPAIRYQPRLLVTLPETRHEHVLAPTRGGQSPWHVVWTYRALNEPPVHEADILDLIELLLVSGEKAGLFRKLHQDGAKSYYAIAAEAARLVAEGVHLVCDETERAIVRPRNEAELWKNAPSLEYYARRGRYRVQEFRPRQRYYQDRYNKGALRRVVAEEHTGLLATKEREKVEGAFKKRAHADDPNVLTCTSTLEMGIDIGDLSSTMLCSIPPSTASYLQRIGRAGRATGTALIVSVVNQRPHDLFFYARPMEMLKGRVDPPGCWLDASAVLVRQYLGFCFDTATGAGELKEIPRSGGQLVQDLSTPQGHIPRMMAWVTQREAELQQRFLQRFRPTVQPDTRERFLTETDTQLLLQKIHQAAGEFDRTRKDLDNARKRLGDQLKSLDEEEKEARLEIRQELRILRGRINSMNRTGALELLTDHGLLPNYAFPERGVRFYGAIYNRHQGAEQEHKGLEIYRPANAALRELAPWNKFYTHRRQFDIQQIAIGNPQQLLTEHWAICGGCGHMRRVEEINQPGASPACPQCGHTGDSQSQLDVGQQKQFVEFAQSQALSYMEHYDSLSGDRDEERQRGFYDVIVSLDQTRERSSGAVGDDELPFGIEYRGAMLLRAINTGYPTEHKSLAFGPDTKVSETGFWVCRHCGIVLPPDQTPEGAEAGLHRRSCHGRRSYDGLRQKGRTGKPFEYIPLFLYRQLRSEAVRLLLPLADDADIYTLIACLHLGLRLRFEGDPGHLLIQPQIMPDAAIGLKKHYLVLMDAVPGGTGFLKTLYQEKDAQAREGEGIMDVLRRARNALETCSCRQLQQQGASTDTDGCYRCIRTYHLQYKAEQISRERGIKLLGRLIAAGERRVRMAALEAVKPDSLYGSVLEKKFVESLRNYIEEAKGKWEATIIKGGEGFRFRLPGVDRIWELELQPTLGPAQGVMVPCQPDFMLSCDDETIKPVAIFTDGFEYHCHPNNRLADDFNKRRAILESGRYRVWNITWDDLDADPSHAMVCHPKVAGYLAQCQSALRRTQRSLPQAARIVACGMEQLKAFIAAPESMGWYSMASLAVFYPLQLLAVNRTVQAKPFESAMEAWWRGQGFVSLEHSETGQWVYNDRATLTRDFLAFIEKEQALVNAKDEARIVGRLGDREDEVTGSDFKERWRRFLAVVNLMQFCPGFTFWATSEALDGTAPEIVIAGGVPFSAEWQAVIEDAIPSLRLAIEALAQAGVPTPAVEYINEDIDDDAFAELAWPATRPKIAVLAGDQASFASSWQQQGWKVVVPQDIEANGMGWLVRLVQSGL